MLLLKPSDKLTRKLRSLYTYNDICEITLVPCQVSSADTVIFANSLDPDQARQNVGPDLNPNCLTL